MKIYRSPFKGVVNVNLKNTTKIRLKKVVLGILVSVSIFNSGVSNSMADNLIKNGFVLSNQYQESSIVFELNTGKYDIGKYD